MLNSSMLADIQMLKGSDRQESLRMELDKIRGEIENDLNKFEFNRVTIEDFMDEEELLSM